MDLDHLDNLAARAFDGFLVRKDLVRTFSRQYPVPTYVVEFMLGRYCASTEQDEIDEGLEIVERQLSTRTVRAGEEELFKARAREHGRVKLIDLVSARLDAKTDSYVVTLPSLRLNDVRIHDALVRQHERMLTGGFYAEVTLAYDAGIAQEKGGRPFGIGEIREIQLSKRNVLETLAAGREMFTTEEWRHFLLRSVGLEPAKLSPRAQDMFLLRMVPCPVRRAQLQHGRARAARNRQEPPLPAGVALCAPHLGREGHGRPHVREQRQWPARAGLPVRRRLFR